MGWRLHLVPASPDLFDAVLLLPLMDCTRAHEELAWEPRRTSVEAFEEFLCGLRVGSGTETAPLAPRGVRGRVIHGAETRLAGPAP
ncbi:hypothetical protein [Streptomyces sp. NBC_01006]|uniref:hypothetical protein n=1 Tax=Streptomyces sp. NBC_01006 TaxID=2903716 RepID=UPI003869A9F0